LVRFPLEIHAGPITINAHVIFELLAYYVALRLYLRQRRHGDILDDATRLPVLVAAIVGGALGSKLLALFEDPLATWRNLSDPAILMAGKTIVGGLLGGVLAVEALKRRLHIKHRTGDLFAIPLVVGIAIGRIGCFFAGLTDGTYGTATALPWGVDFGDGVRRHPVQLYEIVAMVALYLAIRWFAGGPHRVGDIFRLFLTGYLAWRFEVDFLKPEPRWAGLTAIQWTCLAALAYYHRDIIHLLRTGGARFGRTSQAVPLL
jgi:phosphatidylglycerol:prolipoprotein diacylglycerol transferase